jgi:hypothetical protein
MSSTRRYVSVYFDDPLWTYWGLSWVASLYDIARFQGDVLIIDGGMRDKAVGFLKRLGATVVPLVKRDTPELDVIHTLAAYSKNNRGVYAFWDCVSYFQDNIDHLFDIADKKLVCCRESSAPKPDLRPTLESFGYTNEATVNVSKLHSILKKVAKCYGRTVYGGFFAAPSEVLCCYDAFLTFATGSSFLTLGGEAHRLGLNVFVSNYQWYSEVISSLWCSAIASQLQWRGAFYDGDEKIKVIYIPADMQYSADSVLYHFRNRFHAQYDDYKCSYMGSAFTPKRIMKPSLSKLKKVT